MLGREKQYQGGKGAGPGFVSHKAGEAGRLAWAWLECCRVGR